MATGSVKCMSYLPSAGWGYISELAWDGQGPTIDMNQPTLVSGLYSAERLIKDNERQSVMDVNTKGERHVSTRYCLSSQVTVSHRHYCSMKHVTKLKKAMTWSMTESRTNREILGREEVI